jgi:SAM-dependent methyltransferase
MLKKLRHLWHMFVYALRVVGPIRMMRNALRWQSDREARNVDSGFDRAFGTDTNAALTPREARIPATRRKVATLYLPTMDGDLHAMLDALRWPAPLLRATTFVDLGSGKGRALFIAAMRRFREVIGVELSPVLHEVAKRNLDIMRTSRTLASPVRLVLGDAARFDVPAGPLVVYMYHPFREPIAEAAIAQLVASLDKAPRPAAVLYCHPTLQPCFDERVFKRSGVLRRAADGERATRNFRIGWTVWTNTAWLEARATGGVESRATLAQR